MSRKTPFGQGILYEIALRNGRVRTSKLSGRETFNRCTVVLLALETLKILRKRTRLFSFYALYFNQYLDASSI